MGYALYLLPGWLRGTDIHILINLHGICRDNLRIQFLRQIYGKPVFPTAVGPVSITSGILFSSNSFCIYFVYKML